jgi:uncharacterized protein involved in exopolysaccharide biosynthesis
VGLLVGLVVALVQTPEYQAGVMLQIEPPPPAFASVSDALMVGSGNYWQNTDFYNTQFRVLRSKGLGEKVVARLKLTDREPFKSSMDSASLFMSYVGVEPVPESRLVLVTITHRDPREAALWANTLGDVYIDQSLATRVESARRAMEWLQERLSATQQGMRDAQERLYQSLRTQDLFVPEGSVTAVSTSIAKLQEDFVQAQARRIAIEAALKQAAEMKGRQEELDSLPQVSADAVVAGFNAQIAGLSVELGRLGEKYREGHPEVQKIKAQLEQLKKARQARASQILEALQAEYTQLKKREEELRGAIDVQRSQAANQSRKSTELEALKKETESQKSLYEVLLRAQRDRYRGLDPQQHNAVVDRASIRSTRCVREAQDRGAGFVLGLLAGLRPGLDARPARQHDPRPRRSSATCTSTCSRRCRYDQERDSLASRPTGTYAPRSSSRAATARPGVLVTGRAAEGETTTIVNLARLLAGSGELTVVVDCDLRRAQLHQRLGLSREPGSPTPSCAGAGRRAAARDLDPQPVRDHGQPLPPNPPALLARKRLPELLAELGRGFSGCWLTRPLASATDALLLARPPTTVLVIQHDRSRKLIKRSVNALRKVTTPAGRGAQRGGRARPRLPLLRDGTAARGDAPKRDHRADAGDERRSPRCGAARFVVALASRPRLRLSRRTHARADPAATRGRDRDRHAVVAGPRAGACRAAGQELVAATARRRQGSHRRQLQDRAGRDGATRLPLDDGDARRLVAPDDPREHRAVDRARAGPRRVLGRRPRHREDRGR